MSEVRGARGDRLSTHLGLLLLLLVLALALSERSTGFTTDEGSYAIQAEALRSGSWSIEWPFRSADPAGTHFPYHGGVLSSTQEYAYVNHPLWPIALAAVTSVVPEEIGLRLLSMAGVLGASAASFVLARRLGGSSAARWAFWIVAGSPVLANGFMLWAHAPAAAMAGLVAISLAEVVNGGRPRWGTALVLALLAGVLLRSEFVLLGLAAGLVLAGVGIGRRSRRLGIFAIGCVIVTKGAREVEAWWVRSIVGDAVGDVDAAPLASRAGGESSGWLHGRVRGAVVSVFEGATGSAVAATISVLVIFLVGLVVVNPRRLTIPRVSLLWAAAALTLVRLAAAPSDPTPGLIAAWPLVLVAAVAVHETHAGERCLLALAGLFVLAVFATQYDDGGGLQVGGRFLALAIVPLGVVAALGLQRLRSRLPGSELPLAAVALAGATLGLVTADRVRSDNAAAIDRIAVEASEVVLVSDTQTARLDWRAWPERCWFFADPDHVKAAWDVLGRAGARGATYVLFAPATLEAAGLEVTPGVGGSSIGTVGSGPSSCPSLP